MRQVHPQTIFMTGATGFLGQFLLRDLLRRGQRVVAMLRGPLAESKARLRRLLGEIGLDADAFLQNDLLVLVEGSLPGGLPECTWGGTDAILHSAASLQLFANGNSDPFRTNVEGTGAILDWADHHKVRSLHAVSTAYVCGWNNGRIKEVVHRPEPSFQTDYEKSKWRLECILDKWSGGHGRTTTVFRPSFLIGDSQTGYTSQFGGFYQFGRLVSMLKNQFRDPNNGHMTHIPLRIPGRPEDRQNIVPVDFVSQVIVEAILRPQFHGRIYHVTNPEPPTNDLMKQCCEEFFGLDGGSFADPEQVVGKCSHAESLLWDQYNLLTPRVVHTPSFDMANTQELMATADIQFPLVDRDLVLMLFRFAAERGWGRANGNRK